MLSGMKNINLVNYKEKKRMYLFSLSKLSHSRGIHFCRKISSSLLIFFFDLIKFIF